MFHLSLVPNYEVLFTYVHGPSVRLEYMYLVKICPKCLEEFKMSSFTTYSTDISHKSKLSRLCEVVGCRREANAYYYLDKEEHIETKLFAF